jgi:uncharacterized protein (DUF885 family)
MTSIGSWASPNSGQGSRQAPGSDAIRRFTTFADECLKSAFEFMPPVASQLGLHEYDGRTPDLTKESIDNRVRELDRQLAELEAIDTPTFDADTRLDYDLLKQGLTSERFKLGEQREHTYSPMQALFLCDVTGYIKRNYAPARERVAKLAEYERGIPRLIEQSIALFEPPLARPHLEIAIQMCTGQLEYMRTELPDTVSQQLGGQLPAHFTEANNAAAAAVERYIGYLQEQTQSAKEDFAIGQHMFERMLAVNELVDLPLERVLEEGRANLQANKSALIEVARLIDPGKDVAQVAEVVADNHPTEQKLISDAASMLEALRQYLIDHDLITVPSQIRCQVQETPSFLRWGFAFMSPPGPFEEKATEAYYYVTPVEQEWTPEQKEEWLRRFNYPTLADVSIHEAYPGHYVHFLHSSNVMSPVRKTFGSYSFVEGWAHYCEQMMVEQGYGAGAPVHKFAQLSEALLRNCRYVVSIMMHTNRMSLDEATRFFMENGFMDELPARKEAIRGTFDPGYLNYTLGKLLLLKLRDDIKAKEGERFNLKQFHDRMLALGYPPVPLVRNYLLGEDSGPIL